MKNLIVFLSLVSSITLQAAKIPAFVFERNTPTEKPAQVMLSIWYSYEADKTVVKLETLLVVTSATYPQKKVLFSTPTCTYQMDTKQVLIKVECTEALGSDAGKLVVLRKPTGLFTATLSTYDAMGGLKNEEILDEKLVLKNKPELLGRWDFIDQPLSSAAKAEYQIHLIQDITTGDFTLSLSTYTPGGYWQTTSMAKDLKCNSTLSASPSRQAFESIECSNKVTTNKTVGIKITQQSNGYCRAIYYEKVGGIENPTDLGSKYILRDFGKSPY